MDQKEQIDYKFKVVLSGASYTGKTNILSRYTRDVFDTTAGPTLNNEFGSKTLTIADETVKLIIWDTAGQ